MKDGAFKFILPYLLRKKLRRMAGREAPLWRPKLPESKRGKNEYASRYTCNGRVTLTSPEPPNMGTIPHVTLFGPSARKKMPQRGAMTVILTGIEIVVTPLLSVALAVRS